MRARGIKPGFFKNEILSELEPICRLLFVGLWCMADREGRLEDRPKRIKAELFPYENIQTDKLLNQLTDSGFITRYSVESEKYIEINKFKQHQHCHVKESESNIPAPDKHGASTVQTPGENVCNPSTVICNPSTEIPLPKPGPRTGEKDRFLDFVFLTDDQKEKLNEKFGEKGTEERISALDIYIGKIGEVAASKKYKSHYHTILDWERRNGVGEVRASKNTGNLDEKNKNKKEEENERNTGV